MKSSIFNVLISFILFFLFSQTIFSQSNYEVFVSSRGTSSVKKYDLAGNFLGDFVDSNSGGLLTTEDILFHPDGSVLVSGFGNTSIKRYDGVSGEFLGDFSSGYTFAAPSKMSIGPDSLIYVTQWGVTQNKVVRLNLSGVFVDEFTSIGISNGLGHVWDDNHNFYIAVYGTGSDGTIHKFDSMGNDLGIFINSNELQGPTSIWWDENGDMLVEDWVLGKVFRYNNLGEYQGLFIQIMTSPEGIAFMPDGKFLIGDWGQDAVHLFEPDGTYLGIFTAGNGLLDPNSVKIRLMTETSIPPAQITKQTLSILPIAANNSFSIDFSTQKAEEIKLKVWNVYGKELETIFEGFQTTLQATYIWKPGHHILGGFYIITLESNENVLSHKILIGR